MARRKNPIPRVDGLPERIKQCREASGYSMEYIGKKIGGITRSAFRNYELGLAEPSLSALIEMSKLFGVSVEYLLGITGIEKSSKLKSRLLNDLQNIINQIDDSSSKDINKAKAKEIVGETIRAFTNIIEKNISIINCPEKNRTLYELEYACKEMNAAVTGERMPSKLLKPYINIKNWQPYRNIQLLRDFLQLFSQYCITEKQEYTFL